MKYLEKDNLKEEIKEGIWIVDFYADWCGPCKMMGSVLEEVKANVLKVNIDNFQSISNEYGIMSIPTLIFFKDGVEKNKLIGFQSKEIIEEELKKID